MRNSILTSERLIQDRDQSEHHKASHKYICVLTIIFLFFGIFIFHSSTPYSEIFLKKPHMCDTCQVIPALHDYSICKTCRFHIRNNKELKCPNGQGDIKIYDVEVGTQHNALAITLVYEHCAKNWKLVENNYICTINLFDLLKTSKSPNVDVDSAAADLVDEYRPIYPIPYHKPKHTPNSYNYPTNGYQPSSPDNNHHYIPDIEPGRNGPQIQPDFHHPSDMFPHDLPGYAETGSERASPQHNPHWPSQEFAHSKNQAYNNPFLIPLPSDYQSTDNSGWYKLRLEKTWSLIYSGYIPQKKDVRDIATMTRILYMCNIMENGAT